MKWDYHKGIKMPNRHGWHDDQEIVYFGKVIKVKKGSNPKRKEKEWEGLK